jgi:adenylosuccinate synthase
VARRGIRAGDLRDAERAESLIREAVQRANERLRAVDGEPVDADAVVGKVLGARDRLLPLITETGREIHHALGQGRTVLLEGAQGALLDIDHGTFPYVTSSNTTAAGAATGTGIGPTAIDAVLGVVKAYTTRVGSGPLPTELESEVGERLRTLGGEFGATTGRPRRCGWFDAVVVRYAARVNGLTGLALTKLDVLDSFDEVRICTGYMIDGDLHEEFPDDLARIERAQPVFESLPGWNTSTASTRSIGDLPAPARAYLDRLEALAAVPIEFVSVGTQREQIIRVG